MKNLSERRIYENLTFFGIFFTIHWLHPKLFWPIVLTFLIFLEVCPHLFLPHFLYLSLHIKFFRPSLCVCVWLIHPNFYSFLGSFSHQFHEFSFVLFFSMLHYYYYLQNTVKITHQVILASRNKDLTQNPQDKREIFESMSTHRKQLNEKQKYSQP